MTLEVPFEGFVGAAKRMVPGQPVFLAHESGGTRLSCADPAKRIRVVAFSPSNTDEVALLLKKDGVETSMGLWVPDDAPSSTGDVYVAAIAYRTEQAQPGLWVDAFHELPSSVTATKALYDEFRETGQIADVPLEEFVRLAEPTVVILSPAELRGFAASKNC